MNNAAGISGTLSASRDARNTFGAILRHKTQAHPVARSAFSRIAMAFHRLPQCFLEKSHMVVFWSLDILALVIEHFGSV
jgi:hypothetical protein